MIPGYAELHCVTNYTFLRGASDPEELVHRAAELGYAALAITDECSVAGVVRAHGAAKAEMAEMQASERRAELIPKREVLLRAGWLLTRTARANAFVPAQSAAPVGRKD